MTHDIPPQRRRLAWLGLGLAALGVGLFGTAFLRQAFGFDDVMKGPIRAPGEMETTAILAFSGLALVATGLFMRQVAVRGLAGSGLILNPRQARRDLEPWSRLGGGVIKDALHEAQIAPGALPFDEKLRRLEALRKDGLLTEAEYATKRAELLAEKI